MGKRWTCTLLTVGLVLGAVYVGLALSSRPMPDHPFLDRRGEVLVIAHRGGGGQWPENALYAFERMNIEIKPDDPALVEPFCALSRQFGLEEKVLVPSLHPPIIRALRRRCPEVATAAVESEVRLFVVLTAARLGNLFRPRAEALQVPEYGAGRRLVTRRFVRQAGAHNMDVHVWTVNDPAAMRRLIEIGVGGIMTDHPDRLLALLGRFPNPPPPPPDRPRP